MPIEKIKALVINVVNKKVGETSVDVLVRRLESPLELSNELADSFKSEANTQGYSYLNDINKIKQYPYVHLIKSFEISDLPNTPTSFIPVPESKTILSSIYSVLLIMRLMGNELISYKSENEGNLYVNLVTLSGEGRFADKSKKNMRGHTDAASFPFRGESNKEYKNIAPSPDFVVLVCLRNPNGTPTIVMPLSDILKNLSAAEIAELKKSQFGIQSQQTFRDGMKKILGEVLTLVDSEILRESDDETWIRFSHSNVTTDDQNSQAEIALQKLIESISCSAKEIILEPGDILIVNNRVALHGRGSVGDDVGNQSRWLLRTYGLSSEFISENQRYSPDHYMLYP